MRVVCHTVEAFLDNLEGRKRTSIVEFSVWVDQTRRMITEMKFLVNLQASCVVDMEDGQFLLQYGEDCGIDFDDGEKDLSGTEEAKKRREKLEEWCKSHGLVVRPGSVDF